MTDRARDGQDQVKQQLDIAPRSVHTTEVSQSEVAAARQASMDSAKLTTHSYFGTPQFFDSKAEVDRKTENKGAVATESRSEQKAEAKPEAKIDFNDPAERQKSREMTDRISQRGPGVTDEFYKGMKETLSQLPSRDLAELEKHGIKVKAVKHIKEGGGAGVFDGKTVQIAQDGLTTYPDGTREPIKNSRGAQNEVIAHEVGHALGHVRGMASHDREGLDSNNPGFKKAHAQDVKAGWKGQKTGNHEQDFTARDFYNYHAKGPTGREEAYAQSYAMTSRLAAPEHAKMFAEQFPRTTEWMRRRSGDH